MAGGERWQDHITFVRYLIFRYICRWPKYHPKMPLMSYKKDACQLERNHLGQLTVWGTSSLKGDYLPECMTFFKTGEGLGPDLSNVATAFRGLSTSSKSIKVWGCWNRWQILLVNLMDHKFCLFSERSINDIKQVHTIKIIAPNIQCKKLILINLWMGGQNRLYLSI